MSKHTQAPWTLRRHATNHQTLTGATAGLIADIHKDEDARLIAAAPDLLAALEACLHRLDSHDDQSVPECLAALAAIHKATGESA